MKSLIKFSTKIPIVFFVLVLVACNSEITETDPPEMWGELSPGDYNVGFKTLYLYDTSRPAVPYSDWDGKLYPTEETAGRQMQLNIWYPAKALAKSERLNFSHYVNLIGQQTEFGELNAERIAFADNVYISKTNALGGNGSFNQAALDSLKNLKTHAFLEAPPVDGTFPVVLFPNGTSPAFQSIMCEYLASHGFVVGATGLKGMQAYTEEISAKGVEMAVIDIDFAIQNLLELPMVDKNKIGFIGNAITASQSVAYQNRNSNVDCIISLEGGLLSSYEQGILSKTPFYEPQAVDIPILAIYAPHPSIKPDNIFHLKYADRYFLHFPQMTEFHMLNYGQFERFVPNIIGEHEGDVKRGNELASLYSMHFLKAFLHDNTQSEAFLAQEIPDEYKEHIDTSFIMASVPKVPGIAEIKNAFMSNGFEYIDSVYQAHKKFDPAPFSEGFFSDMKDWLAWKKDPEYINRYNLYKIAYEGYPDSANVNYYLGYFAMETGHAEEAKLHFKKSLEILRDDEDLNITIDRKKRLQQSIEELLVELFG